MTGGLKHVTKDMKTKNMEKVSGPISDVPVAAKAAGSVVVGGAKPKGEPKLYEKQGKWFVV